MIALAVAASLLLAAADPPAEPVRDRDIPVAQAPRVYNLPTAETLAAEGYTGVRAFFTNGWGRHQPAVAVLRKGEAAPEVFAWTKGEPVGVRSMSGEIGVWDWPTARLLMDEVRASPVEQPEKHAAWSAPAKADDDESIFVCTDSWRALVEVIADGKVTRRERGSCGSDLTFEGASGLLTLAADSIEACNAIELDSPNRPITRLLNCSLLTGEDRWSAAELLNAHSSLLFAGLGQVGRIAELLDPSARLTLPDGSARQGPAIADWYVAEAARRKESGLQTDTVSVAGDTGQVVGGLFYMDEDDDHYFWAPSEQTWRRVGEDWRLVSWTVGAWRRETFKDWPLR